MNQSDKHGINQAEKFISEFPLSFVFLFWEGGGIKFHKFVTMCYSYKHFFNWKLFKRQLLEVEKENAILLNTT